MDVVIPETGQLFTRCEERVLVFCALDAYGTYDLLGVELSRQHPNRIMREQIELMNDSMRARSPYAAWERSGLLGTDMSELRDLPLDADLAEMPDDQWEALQGPLRAAYERVIRSGIGAAAVTKILYLHRPRLIAITDGEVAGFFGCQALPPVDRSMAVAERVRELARFGGNLAALEGVQSYLSARTVAGKPVAVSKVRILDALIWMKQRGAYARLWEAYGWGTL